MKSERPCDRGKSRCSSEGLVRTLVFTWSEIGNQWRVKSSHEALDLDFDRTTPVSVLRKE